MFTVILMCTLAFGQFTPPEGWVVQKIEVGGAGGILTNDPHTPTIGMHPHVTVSLSKEMQVGDMLTIPPVGCFQLKGFESSGEHWGTRAVPQSTYSECDPKVYTLWKALRRASSLSVFDRPGGDSTCLP